MSTAAQRYNRAVDAMETAGLDLARDAELFAQRLTDTQQRMYRTANLFQAARRYAAAVRRLARLRP